MLGNKLNMLVQGMLDNILNLVGTSLVNVNVALLHFSGRKAQLILLQPAFDKYTSMLEKREPVQN